MNAERLLAHYEQIAGAPDAIARLRRFILDLAVRGKLVPQDAEDEPAAELLKRIAKVKARLVKAGEARKAEIDPAISEGAPFFVPSNWVWTRLGSIGDWGSGSTPPRGNSDLYGGGIPWFKSGELNDNRVLAGSEETITQLAIDKGSFRLNKPGDVLLAMYGATIGKVAILAQSAVTNQAVCGCTPFAGVDNQFLFLFLLSQREQFHSASEGGAQPNISKVKIVWTPFPLPPLAEQQRIVAKVDELMALCDELEEARVKREATRDRLTVSSLARLDAPDPETFQDDARFALNALPVLTTRPDQIKQLRQTILNLAVRGKLVPQDPNDEPASELLIRIAKEKARLVKAGDIRRRDDLPELAGDGRPFLVPSTWVWCRLGALGWTQTGTTPPKAKPEHYGDYIPFIKPGDLYPNHVDYSNEGLSKLGATESGRIATSGSILMVCIGTIGKCQRIERECSFNQQINSLSPFSATDSRYLLVACQSEMFQRAAWAASARTTIAILNKGNWELLAVPLPPLAEQHRIVAKVDELMGLCDQLEASLTDTAATRSRLLDSLLAETLESA